MNKVKFNHSDTNTEEDYEYKNHIDIDISFEEVVKQTVIKILREIRYKEDTIEDDNNYEYRHKESEEESEEEEEMDTAGGAVSH